jgi:photosystem II stability/assembly factor-like uncharacterized protein
MVSFPSPKKGIIVSKKGSAYITDDGGFTWKGVAFAKYNDSYSYISSISFVGENLGWLLRFPTRSIYLLDTRDRENGIFRTSDGEASWEQLPQPLNSLIYQVKFIDNNKSFYMTHPDRGLEKLRISAADAYTLRPPYAGLPARRDRNGGGSGCWRVGA